MIIVAHPDDEVLGCGGFINKYKKINDLILTIGIIFIINIYYCNNKNIDE